MIVNKLFDVLFNILSTDLCLQKFCSVGMKLSKTVGVNYEGPQSLSDSRRKLPIKT